MNSNANISTPPPLKKLSLEKAFNIAFFEKDSFSNFLSFDINSGFVKSEYNERVIYQPSPKLREYHKFINEFILSHLRVNYEVVFSYRKGCNAYNAVSLHSSSLIFFNTDIKNFFPSVDRKFASEIIFNNIDNIPISDLNIFHERILDFIIVDDILPIGFSTSPSFSNASLYDFDNALQEYCIGKGFLYTRYSDDMIISSSKISKDFENIFTETSSILESTHGSRFSLNRTKTKVVRKGNKVKMLGMVILPSGKVSVDIKIKKKVEHLIHFFSTDKEKFKNAILSENKNKMDGFSESEIINSGVSTVSGLLNHINTIDKEYLNKLRRKYGNVIIDMFFRNSVS